LSPISSRAVLVIGFSRLRHRLLWLLLAALALLWPAGGHGQDVHSGNNPWFVRAGIAPAFILPTNPFVSNDPEAGDPIGWAPSVTVEVGRRTDGSKEWHKVYGMPSYGFGFSTASFRSNVERTRPMEAYGFFSWPFASLTERLDLTTEFGAGVSWNWTQVNDQTGVSRALLGSDLNARIDWGFYLRYLLTSRNMLYMGIDFTHRSNAGLVKPNLGINVLGPKVMVQRNFGSFGADIPTSHDVRRLPGFQPAWEFVISESGGVKNVIETTGRRHDVKVIDTTAGVQRHFYRFGKIAAGTDVTYDGSTGAGYALGFYGGYEHIVGRFSAIVQMGYNAARGFDDPDVPRFYQKFGCRYYVNDRVFITFTSRTTGLRDADGLEVGAGYRLRWLPKS
jgi:hypothetical protein